jgi:hypothetical protein
MNYVIDMLNSILVTSNDGQWREKSLTNNIITYLFIYYILPNHSLQHAHRISKEQYEYSD